MSRLRNWLNRKRAEYDGGKGQSNNFFSLYFHHVSNCKCSIAILSDRCVCWSASARLFLFYLKEMKFNAQCFRSISIPSTWMGCFCSSIRFQRCYLSNWAEKILKISQFTRDIFFLSCAIRWLLISKRCRFSRVIARLARLSSTFRPSTCSDFVSEILMIF